MANCRYLRQLESFRTPHNPKVAGSNPAPRYAGKVLEAVLVFVPTAFKSYIPWVYNYRMSEVDSSRQRRINMRVTERQERILRAAAELSGETLTGFVLSVATERAEDVVARSQRIDVSVEAFERFVAAVDAPPEEMPTTQRYASKQSQIPGR